MSVRICHVAFLSIVLSLNLISCKKRQNENASALRFLALNQDKRIAQADIMDRHFLIHDVDEVIDVKIIREGDCLSEASARMLVDGAFQKWIAALQFAQDRNMIRLQSPLRGRLNFVSGLFHDAVIHFRCQTGRTKSTFRTLGSPEVAFYLIADNTKNAIDKAAVSAGKLDMPFLRIVMLHEFGHLFGLADGYRGNLVDAERPQEWKKHDVSTGGDPNTVGSQPLSIMATPRLFKNDVLQEDDIAGIAWLYRYFVTKRVRDKKDCTAVWGYVYDPGSGGCVPTKNSREERHDL